VQQNAWVCGEHSWQGDVVQGGCCAATWQQRSVLAGDTRVEAAQVRRLTADLVLWCAACFQRNNRR
jgi:hypothetical protein